MTRAASEERGGETFDPSPARDAGQDNPNPPAFFPDHAIVKFGGKFYDPSYGMGPYNSEAEYDNQAIAGFLGATVVRLNGNPIGCALVARMNDQQYNSRYIPLLSPEYGLIPC